MAERTNPHANLIIGAQDEASPVFDKIKASSQGMAAGVEQSANKAGAALDGMGDKAPPSAGKVDGATKSIIASIERATAAMQAGEKGSASYYEALAKQRGVSGDTLKPYIDGLRQAEEAQKAALLGQQGMAMSAKQTAAALRGVPAQITDIVVSLQGGQAPMTVLLQQGGQLKDMFGGIAPAARALGGAVLGLVNPFTIAAAAVAGIAVAYDQGSKESEAFNKTLILTGNAAGTSASSLADMARAIDATSAGITQSKAAEVLNTIAASGDVASDKLQRYAKVASEFERAGGGSVESVAKAFSDLAGDPLAAVEKLNKSTNFLTAEIYNQIKALEDEGRSTEAARVGQDAYASMLEQSIPKLKDNLGLLERGWMGVKDAAAEAWDSMLNVGRAQTIGGRLEAAQKLLADYESTLPGKRTTEQVARVAEAGGVNGLRNQIAGLQELMETQRKADEQQRANNQSTQAAINLSKQASQFDTDLEKQRKAVAKATQQYTTALAAGNLSEAARAQLEKDYLKTVSGITAAKEQRGTTTRKENTALRDQQRIFAELAGVSSTYYSELANYQKQRAAGVVTEDQYVAAVEKLIKKQPFAVELAKEETEANKALSKAYAEAAAERLKTIQSMERAADSLQSQNDALRDEIELIGLSAEQQTLVLQQRNDVIILTKEATLAELERQSAITGTQTRVEIALAAEIAALKERNELLGAKGVKDAAKQAEGEWKKTTDQINQSLTDALMRGFESGKGFAQNLRDTVVNMFQTMVLRPMVQVIVSPVAQAVTGTVNSVVQGATGINMLGVAGNAASLAGIGTTAAVGFGNAASSLGFFGGNALDGMLAANGAFGTAATGSALGAIGAALPLVGGALAIGSLLGGLFGGGSPRYYLKTSSQDNAGGEGFEDGVKVQSAYGYIGLGDKWTKNIDANSMKSSFDAIAQLDNAIAAALSPQQNAKISAALDGYGSEKNDSVETYVKGRLDIVTQTIGGALGELAGMFSGTTDQLASYVVELANAQKLLPALADLGAFGDLDAAMLQNSQSALKLADALQTTFGSTDNATTALQSYYANFYTEQERTAAETQKVSDAFAQLGLAMPSTRDAFRSLVQAQDVNTEAGRSMYASLIALSGAFASVTENMKRLQSDTANLQIELLRAQGNTAGADAAQRAIDTSGMSAAEVAIYDYNTALRAQITSLNDAAAAAQEQAQREAEAFVSLYGDVAAAMAEINPPAKTLVDTFRSTQDELTNLTNGLAQALGNLPEPTTLEQFRASMEILRGIGQASADLQDQIFGIQVARGDQAAVDLLKAREAALYGDLQTSADPAGVARNLSQTVLQRIALEGKLEEQAINARYKAEFDAAQAVADLESKNRRAQMDALRDQISSAGRLAEIAQSMAGFVGQLKFGDLSALNPADQLAAAQGEYQRILTAAQGGDVAAAGQLQSAATAYLQEQQGYSGGATSGYASIFSQIVDDLDAFGTTPVSDISLMQDQLTSLEALEKASTTLQSAVVDTSQRQIEALGSINVALLSRSDETKARANEQKAILEKQVEALSTLVEDQKAQIAQAAATHKAMMDRLEAMANNIDRITANSNQAAAQPA